MLFTKITIQVSRGHWNYWQRAAIKNSYAAAFLYSGFSMFVITTNKTVTNIEIRIQHKHPLRYHNSADISNKNTE
jgi:hypothetical protein